MGDTWHMLTSASYVAWNDVARDNVWPRCVAGDVADSGWMTVGKSLSDTWHDVDE
jgi:hypothetical protein